MLNEVTPTSHITTKMNPFIHKDSLRVVIRQILQIRKKSSAKRLICHSSESKNKCLRKHAAKKLGANIEAPECMQPTTLYNARFVAMHGTYDMYICISNYT